MNDAKEVLERMAKAFYDTMFEDGWSDESAVGRLLHTQAMQAALRELVEIHREEGTIPMLFKVLAITELEL